MQTKPLLKKGLACAVIFLFVGTSAVSAVDSNPLNNEAIKKSKEVSVRGDIAYAWIAYDPTGEHTGGIAEFDLNNPGNITYLGNGSGISVITGSDFDLNGNWYAVTYYGGLYFIDPDTGDMTLIASTIPLNGLTYDVTTDTWYASGGSPDGLNIIDIATGATTYVGSYGISNIMISIFCDTDGNLYGYDALFSGDSHLYSIDKTTGAATVIGDMGHDFCYAQDGKFDRNDGILYLVAYDIGMGESYLATCDPVTGAVTIIGLFQMGMELDGLAIPYYSEAPILYGPDSGAEEIWYKFWINYLYGPNQDLLEVICNWGDGNISEWNVTGIPGQNISGTHKWEAPGVYAIRIRLRDMWGGSSPLSDPHNITIVENTPPKIPDINGTLKGKPGSAYLYTFVTTDPENNDVSYFIDWADSSNTSWLGPYASGTQKTASHSWSKQGTYTIKIKAKDVWGAESDWGTLQVTMPLLYEPPHFRFFEWLFERFPNAFLMLRHLLGY